MPVLTPDERRGAATVALLLCLGAAWDLWRLWCPPAAEPPGPSREAPTLAGALDPSRAGTPPSRPAGPPAAVPADSGAKVDLNRAGVAELDALPGIGPVLAARIVAHRERHGGFQRPEELLAVRGIGPRAYARLAGRVRVGSPAGGAAAPDTVHRRIR